MISTDIDRDLGVSEAIGFASFVGVGSIFAKQMYDTYSQIKKMRNAYKDVGGIIQSQLKNKIANNVTLENVSRLGYSKIAQSSGSNRIVTIDSTNFKSLIKDLDRKTYGNKTAGYLKHIMDKVGGQFNVHYGENNRILKIVTAADTPTTIIDFAINNRINYGGKFNTHTAFVPGYFYDSSVSAGILEGTINRNTIKSTLQNNYMTYNEAYLRDVLHNINTHNFHSNIKAVEKTAIDFSKFHLIPGYEEPGLSELVHMNSMEFLRYDKRGYLKEWSVYDDNSIKFGTMINELLAGQGKLPITFMKSQNALASNGFLNPFAVDPELEGFVDRIVNIMGASGNSTAHTINGQKKMFQAFGQPTEIIDADDFKVLGGNALADGGLKEYREATNSTAVTEMQILDNDKFAEKLLYSGDYSGGVPLAIAQDEGYIADMSLLKKHNVMHENVRVSLGEGQNAAMVTDNFTSAMEGFALHDSTVVDNIKDAALKAKIQAELQTTTNKFEAARNIKSWLKDPANAKYADEYNQVMVEKIAQLNNDRAFTDIISREYNGQLSTSYVFGNEGSSVLLGKGVEGSTTIHSGKHTYIGDVSFSGGESRLKLLHTGTLLESGGKSWSPAKDLLIGVMDGDHSAKQFLKDRMLIERILNDDPNAMAQMEQFASNPNQYRDAINQQYSGHAQHINSFVDQLADIKITKHGARSLDQYEGQTSANFFNEMSNYIMKEIGADKYANGQFKSYFEPIPKDGVGKKSFGLRLGYHNSGTPTGHHYKDTPVAINSINVNRLRSNDYEDAAKYLESYYNWADYDALLQEAMPMIDPKRINKNTHVGFSLDKLSQQSIDILFGANGQSAQESRAHANYLAKQLLGMKDVSDNTRYYIQVNKELGLNMMLPLTDTNYTRELNQANMEIDGRPMFKEWQSDIYSYINNVRSGKLSEDAIKSQHRQLTTDILSRIFNPTNFTKAIHPNARSYRVVSDEMFSPSMIEKLIQDNPGQRGAIEGVLQSYGLNLQDMKDRPIVFMGNEDFENALDQAPKELYDKYFSGEALDKEYRRLESASPGLDENALREATIANQRKAIQADGLYSIISREPSYSAEGTDIGKIIHGPEFQRELYEASGRNVALESIDNQWAGEKSVRINDEAMQRIAGDLDEDTLKSVIIDDEAVRQSTGDLYKTKTPYKWKRMVGKKSGFRGFAGNKDIMTTYLGSTQTEKENIAKVYMKVNTYGTSFHGSDANIFADSAELASGRGLSASDKRSLFNHFITTAPERAIGAKGIKTPEQAAEFLKIFDSNVNIDDRVNQLLNMGWSPSEGDTAARQALFDVLPDSVKTTHGITDVTSPNLNLMHLFEKDELKKALEYGDTMSAKYSQYFNKGKLNPNQIDQMITAIMDAHSTGNETNIKMLSTLLAGANEKTKLQTAGDVVSGAVKGLMKNKLALGIAGGAIAASYLLRPSSTEIKNQDTREESRRKGVIPKGAEAIDPPMASVYKPHARGMQYNVSGPISGSQSPEALYQSNFGMPVQNAYIDRSASADLDYIKRLQQEDKYNDWNRR